MVVWELKFPEEMNYGQNIPITKNVNKTEALTETGAMKSSWTISFVSVE
jgi:hypothetical protein